MPSPKVSIIIPVYRVEDYIVRCLSSLVNQKYDNIEIVLVDDCGGDNSIEKAEEYLKSQNTEYKLSVNDGNKGPSYSRNQGLKIATGKYVFFLDSDDSMDKYCISQLVEVSENAVYNVELAFCDFIRFKNVDEIQSCDDDIQVEKKSYNYRADFIRTHGFMCGTLFKRDIIAQNNLQMPTDINYMEDNIWYYNYLKYVDIKRVAFVKSAKYHYFENQGSLSRPKSKRLLVEKTLACLKYFDNYFYATELEGKELTDAILAKRYFRNCFFGELYTIDKNLKEIKATDENKKVLKKRIFSSDLGFAQKALELIMMSEPIERIIYKTKFSL